MSFPFVQPYFGLGNSLQTAQGGAGAVGGWVELGRTTLGSAGDVITVSSLSDKRYYMILEDIQPNAQVEGDSFRLNNDSGSNYAYRYSGDGASDITATSQAKMGFAGSHPTTNLFNVNYLANLSSKEKLHQRYQVVQSTAGAGTAPSRGENVGKHANTSSAVNRVDIVNTFGTNRMNSGSECVVLGYDPDDTHTTNFFEELASVDLSGGANNAINSGVFSAKKYIWVQVFVNSSTGSANNYNLRVGNTTIDTGSNYAFRYSIDGAADATAVSQDTFKTSFNSASGSEPCLMNCFIINNSANEKLFISDTVRYDTAGAGTAPHRYQSVGKWANTSNQIDTVRFYHQTGASTFGTGTVMKVWGSD